MLVNILKNYLVIQNMFNDLIEKIRSLLMEMGRHIGVSKSLVGLTWKTVADFKTGQSKILCFRYLPLKLIYISYSSNYFVDLTPNQVGSISPDKFHNFIIHFNHHDEVVVTIVYVKF